MGEFTKDEFIKGCTAFKCYSLQAWKEILKSKLYPELQNETAFSGLYKFTFGFATERGYKNVEVETACALWELFLGKRCQFLEKWIKFLTEEKKDNKVITRDTWELFYDLVH